MFRRAGLWILASALTLGSALIAGEQAAEPPDEKLLFGFEEADVQKMVDGFKAERKEGKDRDGRPNVTVSRTYFMHSWTLYKGNASQGDYAMGLSKVGDPAKAGFAAKVQVPEAAAHYYGITNGSGAVFNTCGMFRKLFPIDWSSYDLLRIDVWCEAAPHTFRIALEDEEIAPPVIRSFTVEPGKWTTLEVDLQSAAKARGLDLKRMTTLTVGVVQVDAKVAKPFSALLDHVRLAKKKTAAKLPVLRDDTSHDLPEYFRASAKPPPVKLSAERPDHAPLQLEKPIVITTETTSVVNPVGWVAAYDNKHLLVGYLEKNSVPPAKVYALQSLDAGKTWGGLDGSPKPSSFMIVGSDHGGGGGNVVGNRADVVVLTNLGCRGGSVASLRLFAQQLTFAGKGWELRELPSLVDCDLRHCNSNQSVIRAPDGRLWAAYGLAGRLTATCINIRYSDDDGLTWKSWAEGKSGALPGLQKPLVDGWTYNFEEPCLVPFGKGIACIWQEVGGPLNGQVRWSRFEDGVWSAIEKIEVPKLVSGNPTSRPPIHAVSRGGSEIFMVGARFPGVMHYQDGKWTVETTDVPRASRISIAGDKAVMVVAALYDQGDAFKGPVTLQAWQRGSDGKWTGPRELAREELPLSTKSGGGGTYFYRPGFVVQPYAPPNCIPVAWTCEGQKWIKLLRVPVDAK